MGESWDEFLASGDAVDDATLDGRIDEVHESDHGLIMYSSGTTDRPKGMLHTNRAPTLQFWFQKRIFGRHEGTRLWTALPDVLDRRLHHRNGPDPRWRWNAG